MAASPSYMQQLDITVPATGNDDIRTHFQTREGVYRLMKLSEYSRPTRTPQNGATNTPFKVAFVSAPDTYARRFDDLVAFIIGKELYVYYYNGVRKAADLTRPIEKKVYRGPSPTCHDFNQFTAKADRVMLIVGFTLGQIQLIEPMGKDYSKLFNEERFIDNTKVTCIQWVPGSPNHFLAAHASGQLYVYDERLPCGAASPIYQLFKSGSGYSVHTCRAKSTRNPLYRWLVDGSGAVHSFAFSPCAHFLAVVSADGQLRVFNYDRMELVGAMKSYFGGLRCVAWSPDGRYLATGGEDDLVTVWSFISQRVVCRGSGHRSWVNGVSFDAYTTTTVDDDSVIDNNTVVGKTAATANKLSAECQFSDKESHNFPVAEKEAVVTCYRLGSVGDDAMLCLWDVTEDVLANNVPGTRLRTSTVNSTVLNDVLNSTPPSEANCSPHLVNNHTSSVVTNTSTPSATRGLLLTSSSESSGLSQKFAVSLSITDQHKNKETVATGKRAFGTLVGRTSDTRLSFVRSKLTANGSPGALGDAVSSCSPPLGSPGCPSLDEVPLLEPLVCKQVAHERLTAILFREDCMVIACQEGFVSTWARPSVLTKNGYI